MVTLNGWVQGCVAGVIFSLWYNLFLLHHSVIQSILITGIIAIEANLVLLVFFKILEIFGT
jgi:hypothetical protein